MMLYPFDLMAKLEAALRPYDEAIIEKGMRVVCDFVNGEVVVYIHAGSEIIDAIEFFPSDEELKTRCFQPSLDYVNECMREILENH